MLPVSPKVFAASAMLLASFVREARVCLADMVCVRIMMKTAARKIFFLYDSMPVSKGFVMKADFLAATLAYPFLAPEGQRISRTHRAPIHALEYAGPRAPGEFTSGTDHFAP